MNNRLLGIFAMLGAPFLLIGFYVESQIKNLENSWFTGAWGLAYMLGWMAALVGLQRMEATGTGRFGKAVLWIILGTLTLANLSNICQVMVPGEKSQLFFILDTFWLISNVLMIPVGIATIVAKQLPGWKRYVPLLVGLWFPLGMATISYLGRVPAAMFIGGFHSAMGWGLLGYVVYSGKAFVQKSLAVAVA